ncbi:LRR receptor-like serine/threonine-protein kinase [Nymphaea thermarum]|nr:LRR receptor-like serine/threonine-protein kinase [Nymphaea thermarum]
MEYPTPCIALLFICTIFSTTLTAFTHAWLEKPMATSALCLPSQCSALLRLKQGIQLQPGKLISWQKGTNCCHWEGVTCDYSTGFVIELQLSNVSDGYDYDLSRSNTIDSSLFELSHLRLLNLSNNMFVAEIPTRLVELTHLTHLDLSNCQFYGQVPAEISRMTWLVSLNLSNNYGGLQLRDPDFSVFVKDLGRLQQLNLDNVDISMSGKAVSLALSASLPNLQTLSLMECNIFGPIDELLLQLRSLSYLDLSSNSLSRVPEFLVDLTSLHALKFADCNLQGNFPPGVFLLPELENLQISNNMELMVSLPLHVHLRSSRIRFLDLSSTVVSLRSFWAISKLSHLSHLELEESNLVGTIPPSWSSSEIMVMNLHGNNLNGPIPDTFSLFSNLIHLDLSSNSLSGRIPSGLFNLPFLEVFDVSQNNLNGSIPQVLAHDLQHLRQLDLSVNQLIGDIPSPFFNLTSLDYLNLANNRLSGQIPSSFINLPSLKTLFLRDNLLKGGIPTSLCKYSLETLDLSNNNLSGKIPTSLFTIPSLERLNLRNNSFDGPLPAFDSLNETTQLKFLILGMNSLSGKVPSSITSLYELNKVELSSNHFSGTIDLSLFLSLKGLFWLDLSNNPSLTVLSSNSSFTEENDTNIPQLGYLRLSSCNVKGFPSFLQEQYQLIDLDLSDSDISGEIPSWLWTMGNLQRLSLSNNKLNGFQEPLNGTKSMGSLLTDFLEKVQEIRDVDLSNNEISGKIPLWLWGFGSLEFLSLSHNKLDGFQELTNVTRFMGTSLRYFPSQASTVYYLSVSDNRISGQIPTFICRYHDLQLLNMSINKLSGAIPKCLGRIGKLSVLDLHSNQLQGRIPEGFNNLELLNLNNNFLVGRIPKSLISCKDLQVLDLGNNELHDEFPSWLSHMTHLKVLVLRSNHFYGPIISTDSEQTLQIIDVSNNELSGALPPQLFNSLTAMIVSQSTEGPMPPEQAPTVLMSRKIVNGQGA